MLPTTLGRLEKVELRKVWTSEASDFTPWLACEENITLLGDTIGIELEIEAQEQSVGPFRADILCKDTANGTWVLIENQLECTDHVHLGQLLTYAAGLKTVTIVWIAERFTEQHRATLDWLNEITDDRFNFFGLEIELWSIAGSPVAPKFNFTCKPNDWSRIISDTAKTGELTEGKQLQLEYWTAFREYVADRDSMIKPTKAFPQNWMSVSIGRSGFHLNAIATLWSKHTVGEVNDGSELRVELVLDGDHAKAQFAQLELMKTAIEADFGQRMIWHNVPDKWMRRIHVRRPAEIRDRLQWAEQHGWLLENLEAFRRVFAERVKLLDANEYESAEVALS